MLPFGIDLSSALQALGVFLVALGLVGVFVPVLPGTALIWLGAFLWALGDGFQRVEWWVLALMAALLVIGWAANTATSAYFTRRGSSSWLTVIGGIVGGIVGGLLLSTPPIIGNLIGAVLGGVAGVVLVEVARQRALQPALRSSGHYLAGCITGQLVQALFALLMVLVFVWQAAGF